MLGINSSMEEYKNYNCTFCDKIFKTRFSLNHHLIEIHKQEKGSTAMTMPGISSSMGRPLCVGYNCTICERIFKTKWGFNRHLRENHRPNQEKGSKVGENHNQVEGSKVGNSSSRPRPVGDNKNYYCTLCDKLFKTRWGLSRHQKDIHKQEKERKESKKYRCPLCDSLLMHPLEYREHVLKTHEIKLDMHYFKFKSQSHFLSWKRKVERETNSYYVKETKHHIRTKTKFVLEETNPIITKHPGFIHYTCHRSGYRKVCVDDSERKRKFKAQGSAKINAHCPAKISAEFRMNGSVKVRYCSTHVGHKCEVSHLKLTDNERREIAAKIASKIPFDVILDEIRNTAGNGKISRMNLLTRRDLWTISHSSYYKKYCQSIGLDPTSSSPSKLDQSNIENCMPKINESSQDMSLPNNKQFDDIEEFDDAEIQTFDPTDPDSDLDLPSECATVESNQSCINPQMCVQKLPSKCAAIENTESSENPQVGVKKRKLTQLNQTKKRSKPLETQFPQLKSENKCKSPIKIIDPKQKVGSIYQKQSELIEKFCTKIISLTSLKEIRWVENHINHMFIMLTEVMERTEKAKKGTEPVPVALIRNKTIVTDTSDSILHQHSQSPNQDQFSSKLNLSLPASSNVRSQEIIPAKGTEEFSNNKLPAATKEVIPVSQLILPEKGTDDYLVRNKSNIADTASSIFHQNTPEPNDQFSSKLSATSTEVKSQQILRIPRCTQCSKPKLDFQSRLVKYRPVKIPMPQKTHKKLEKSQTTDPAQVKQYLVPIAGNPDKYLIVQTKPDEPAPVGTLTPIVPNQKPTASKLNKNVAFVNPPVIASGTTTPTQKSTIQLDKKAMIVDLPTGSLTPVTLNKEPASNKNAATLDPLVSSKTPVIPEKEPASDKIAATLDPPVSSKTHVIRNKEHASSKEPATDMITATLDFPVSSSTPVTSNKESASNKTAVTLNPPVSSKTHVVRSKEHASNKTAATLDPPDSPFTPVTSNEELVNNKNAAILDHSYSL